MALFNYPLSRLILGHLAVPQWGLNSPFGFFGVLNNALTIGTGRNDFSTIKFFFFFTFLTHIIECLRIIVHSNRWINRNAYTNVEKPVFIALFHSHTCAKL